MSTPQPPNPGEQAWSESTPTEIVPAANPPTQQFAPHEHYGAENYEAGQYEAGQYGAGQYGAEQPYPGQAYAGQQSTGPEYQGQQYPAQGYPPAAEGPQYYAQQPPPPGYGGPGFAPPPPESKTPAWAWALLGVVIVALLGGLGYFAATQIAGSNDAPAATASPGAQGGTTAPPAVTPSSRPTITTTTTSAPSTTAAPEEVFVPAKAGACPPTTRTADFSSSAVTGNTSCPFAEEVRMAYLQQPLRDTTVGVRAWSPITGEWYTMSCTGGDVVRCTGGDNATVYVY